MPPQSRVPASYPQDGATRDAAELTTATDPETAYPLGVYHRARYTILYWYKASAGCRWESSWRSLTIATCQFRCR